MYKRNDSSTSCLFEGGAGLAPLGDLYFGVGYALSASKAALVQSPVQGAGATNKTGVRMRGYAIRLLITSLCVVGATAAAPCAYAASKFDGAWSAVFRTKSGPCPPATRGAVQVANGIIEVASTAGSLSGRVSRTGVVRATGHMGASYGVASGRVSGNFANGTWQAHMAGGSCVGVWTAQRR